MRPSQIKRLAFVAVEGERPKCLSCFAPIDLLHGDAERPRAGDFNVCAHCYAVARYTDENLAMRPARADEIIALRCSGDLPELQADRLLSFLAVHQARRT